MDHGDHDGVMPVAMEPPVHASYSPHHNVRTGALNRQIAALSVSYAFRLPSILKHTSSPNDDVAALLATVGMSVHPSLKGRVVSEERPRCCLCLP
jgi:hypothetical protein